MDKKIAEKVLQRANGYCEVCGKVLGDDYALHHRKLRSRGGKDEVANIIAIHHSCHNTGTNSIHLNPQKATLKGWMIPSYGIPTEFPFHTPEGDIVKLTNEGTKERLDNGINISNW